MSIASLPGIGASPLGPGFHLPALYPQMRYADPAETVGTAAFDAASAQVTGTAPTGTPSFGNVLADKLGELGNLHKTSDDLAIKALTGDARDIHQYTIAANQASVATQLVVNVRNKAVEAFTEVMRMQL